MIIKVAIIKTERTTNSTINTETGDPPCFRIIYEIGNDKRNIELPIDMYFPNLPVDRAIDHTGLFKTFTNEYARTHLLNVAVHSGTSTSHNDKMGLIQMMIGRLIIHNRKNEYLEL